MLGLGSALGGIGTLGAIINTVLNGGLPQAFVTNSLASGNYSGGQTATLSAPNGYSIYYTTDGTTATPLSPSILYTAPIAISATTILHYCAVPSDGTGVVGPQGAAYYNYATGTAPGATGTPVANVDSPGVIYARFTAPTTGGTPVAYLMTCSNGAKAIVSATLINDTGAGGTANYNQLNQRVDVISTPVAQTCTITAISAGGLGPASSASNSVTPLPIQKTYIYDGAPIGNWNNFDYGGTVIFNVPAGQASGITPPQGLQHAPSNSLFPSAGVVELDNTTANSTAVFFPYYEHTNPLSNEGGRWNLAAFRYFEFDVYPTYNQSTTQQGMYLFPSKDLFVDFAATVANSGAVITGSNQSWPVNGLDTSGIINVTTQSSFNTVVNSNTTSTITVSMNLPCSLGDFVEVEIPDVGVGQGVQNVGAGSAVGTVLVNGSTTGKLLANTWNHIKIRLDNWNTSGGAYPIVTNSQWLKLAQTLANQAQVSANNDVYYMRNGFFTP